VYTKTAKKWWVPYGTWIYLTHSEACRVGNSPSVDIILSIISSCGYWAAAAAAQIYAQRSVVRDKNTNSGGKGVRLLFVWATGMIMSIERLGKGSSPCT
jgi:hypothetical protein